MLHESSCNTPYFQTNYFLYMYTYITKKASSVRILCSPIHLCHKKVLLRERKRHTARRCSNGGGEFTPSSPSRGRGVPHPVLARGANPQTWDGVPTSRTGRGYHPIQTWDGVPTPVQTWDGVPPQSRRIGYPPQSRPGMGYPPGQGCLYPLSVG